jgi:hypothetical protein
MPNFYGVQLKPAPESEESVSRLNWTPIKQRAVKAAESLGHKLGPFERGYLSYTGQLKMASCERCFGCCWVAISQRGFVAGGRLLKFRCGTPEAAGLIGDDVRAA